MPQKSFLEKDILDQLSQAKRRSGGISVTT
jgi:hypothetical protein